MKNDNSNPGGDMVDKIFGKGSEEPGDPNDTTADEPDDGGMDDVLTRIEDVASRLEQILSRMEKLKA